MLLAGLPRHEVRDALVRLLDSRAFRRSDQLKKLVVYLCEAELDGRREQLDEYRIGVEALGRPKGFSPEQDSSVRTRTHALRQKLSEYYAVEGAAERVRIEVPKGSYVPEFRLLGGPDTRDIIQPVEQGGHVPELRLLTEETVPAPTGTSRRSRLWTWTGAGLAGAFLLVMGFRLNWVTLGPALSTPRIVRDFWRPALESSRPVALCVGQPVHLWLRDYGSSEPPTKQYPPLADPVPNSETIRDYFRSRTNRFPGPKLVFHPSPNSPLWGDSAGASAAVKFFAMQRVDTELLPEDTLRNSYPLRGRHALVFGREEFSGLVQEMTPSGGYRVRYLGDEGRFAITHEGDRAKRFYNTLDADRGNYGLITVSRSGNELQAVFSGITSDGALAGIDFLTSEEGLDRVWKELGGKWPGRFQVVVRTRSINGYPMKTEYAAHHVY